MTLGNMIGGSYVPAKGENTKGFMNIKYLKLGRKKEEIIKVREEKGI